MFYRLRRIRRLLQIRIHSELLYEHTLQQVAWTERPDGLVVRTLKKEEVSLLKEVWPVDLDRMLKRLERGDLCFAGFINNVICSYHWVQYTGTHFFQQAHQYVKVEKDQGWIYHVRVADWAKGRGVNGFVYATILSEAKRLSKSKLLIYTSADNTSNQKGLSKCGFTITKKIVSLYFNRRYFAIFERSLKQ